MASPGDRDPWTLLAATTAFLLPVAFSPNVYATFWAPKAAVVLVAGGFGLARVPAALGAPASRRPMQSALALLAVSCASTLLSPRPLNALVGLHNWGTGLVFVACLVGMFALGATTADDRRVRVALLAGIGLSCLVGVLQVAADLSLPSLEVHGRPTGLAGNAAQVGALAAAGAAVCAAGRHRAWLLGVLVGAAVAQLTGTRIALLALVLAVALAGVRLGWRRLAALAVVVALGVGAGTALGTAGGVPTATARANEQLLAGGGGGGIRVRAEIWASARHALLERPVLGHGPGRFGAATSADRTLDVVRIAGSGANNVDAHNIVVEHAVTTGVLGAAALLAWLTLALRRARGWPLFGAIPLGLVGLTQPQSVGTTPLLFLLLGAAIAVAPSATSRRLTARPLLVAGALGTAAAGTLLVGNVALLDARNGLLVEDARRADDLIGVWPLPATITARAYAFAALDTEDPVRREELAAAARSWYLEAAARDVSDPEAWITLAERERADGLLDEAERHHRAALEWDPFSLRAFIGLGHIEVARGDPSAAREWFERAYDLDPSADVRALIDAQR
ncbi:MAG TPA: tetratricopeptide repeat protein [Acidimicrobiales bacterium]|nr:tetratricopeptide repeat protein [Acidimicrobiales bacterium]